MPTTKNAVAPEQRLKELGINLPQPPKPLGAYVETLQTGNLLFLSGTLPVEAGKPRYVGRIGDDLSVEDGGHAARLAALNALALAKEHLGSLNKVKQVVRLGGLLAHGAGLSRSSPGRRCGIGIVGQRVRPREDIDPAGVGHGNATVRPVCRTRVHSRGR